MPTFGYYESVNLYNNRFNPLLNIGRGYPSFAGNQPNSLQADSLFNV